MDSPEKKPTGQPEDLVFEDDMTEIVDGFVTESEELLEEMDQDLVILDGAPEDQETIERVFRGLHTLKGNSRALGFHDLEAVVHKTEDVVRKVQDEAQEVTEAMMDAFFESADVIKALLNDVKERKKRNRDLTPMIQKLKLVMMKNHGPETDERTNESEHTGTGTPVDEGADPLAFTSEEALSIDEDLSDILEGFVIETRELLEEIDQDLISLDENPKDMNIVEKVFRGLHTLKGNSRAMGFADMETTAHRTEDVVRKVQNGEMPVSACMMDCLFQAVDVIKALLGDVEEKKKRNRNLDVIITRLQATLAGESKTQPAVVPDQQKKKAPAATIRVDVGKLDKLMNMAGELILDRNRLLNYTQNLEQGTAEADPVEFLGEFDAKLGFLAVYLQTDVMTARMQPISKVFNKYPRVVRDLARETGKEIELVLTGRDTELDNTIVEEIGDPLIHMVRNSCDHGIETPDIRQKAGKAAKGRVNLAAYQEGNFVIIELKDDGKGMDTEILKNKALSKGLITDDQAKVMSKSDILNLIFMPGFSTAEKVTAVSGRGVGMDVVKNSISKFNGIIEMDSVLGKGTMVKIKLPLTMAVLPGVEIEVAGEHYLLSQDCIVEITPINPDWTMNLEIERQFLFREKVMSPLFFLREILGKTETATPEEGKAYMIVIGEGENVIGLMADNIVQRHEVIVKPLGQFMRYFPTPEINGAAVMGNGKVALILNHHHFLALGEKKRGQYA